MLSQTLPEAPERTQEAVLMHLKRHGEMTVGELCDILGITSMAVRRHLASLQKDGLVESRLEKQLRGRPTYKFRLTSKSETLFPSGYESLAIDLLDIVFEESGARGVMQLLERRNEKLISRLKSTVEKLALPERVQTVAKIFSDNGYMTEAQRLEDGSYLLYQRHCAVHDLAHKYRQLCALEPKLMESLLGVQITREKHMLNNDPVCAYRVHADKPLLDC